jgi:hypothetical protein
MPRIHFVQLLTYRPFRALSTSGSGGCSYACHRLESRVHSHMGFAVDRVALGYVFLQSCLFRFFPVCIIPPTLRTHSFIYHRRCIISTNDSVFEYPLCALLNVTPKSVAYRGEVWGVQTLPQKFRSFDKAEPNSQFRGIYIHNNAIIIWISFICKSSGTPD